jgi:hypothetical protein
MQAQAEAGNWAPLGPLTVPSTMSEAVAALLPFAAVTVVGAAVQRSRDSIVGAISPQPTSDAAAQLARGLSGEIGGLVLGLSLAIILGALACAAVGVCASARLRAKGLLRAASLAENHPDVAASWARHPGPSIGLLLSINGTLAAGFMASALRDALAAMRATTTGFAAIAAVGPEEKAAAMDRMLTNATVAITAGRTQGAVLAVAALIAVVLIIAVESPLRDRIRALGRRDPLLRSDERVMVPGAILAAAAVALILTASTWRRENETPWPPRGGLTLADGILTPALDGPDPIVKAPVVMVTSTVTSLDGYRVTSKQLAETLTTLRSNYEMLHPGGDWGGQIVLLCSPDAPAAAASGALTTAAEAGYPNAQFAFVRKEVIDRPLFGRLERTRTTAAVVTSVVHAPLPAATVTITAAAYSTCGDLAREAVTTRRAGARVALIVTPRGELLSPTVSPTLRPAPPPPGGPPASPGSGSAARPGRGSLRSPR